MRITPECERESDIAVADWACDGCGKVAATVGSKERPAPIPRKWQPVRVGERLKLLCPLCRWKHEELTRYVASWRDVRDQRLLALKERARRA